MQDLSLIDAMSMTSRGADPRRWTRLNSPIGSLLLVGSDSGLSRIEFATAKRVSTPSDNWIEDASAFNDVTSQLNAWFAGELRVFEFALNAEGTDFQCAVWNALRTIPFGETRSYADIALQIGRPTASRAVGAANGANPLPIVVPCHRVIGTNGTLTGFAGGVDTKRWLLDHESRHAGPTGRTQALASDQLPLF